MTYGMINAMTSTKSVRVYLPGAYDEIESKDHQGADSYDELRSGTLVIRKGTDSVAIYARGAWLSAEIVENVKSKRTASFK